MDLQRIGVKFFVEDTSFEVRDLVPIFHSWIKDQIVEDHLLIDVHNYSHVHQGPGILLVGHEGNFSLDLTDGLPGLYYYRKQPLEGSIHDRLSLIIETGLKACRRLEDEPDLNGAIKFRGDEVRINANDRLLAPDDGETFESLKPVLSEVLSKLFDGAEFELTNIHPDSGEPFTATATTGQAAETVALLARMA